MNEIDFKLSSYDYDLPESLIARYPKDKRSDSRLLVYNAQTDEVIHSTFKKLHQFLPKKTLLVRNNSKVFSCRLLGKKSSGGKAELFLLSLNPKDGLYPCLVKTSSKKKVGDDFFIGDELVAQIQKIQAGTFWLKFNVPKDEFLKQVEKFGKIPLPPYMNREADEQDNDRYQTVYAQKLGSVAAPTAGLHFDDDVFSSLKEKAIEVVDVTLHVGVGTFKPVECDDIRDHKMHSEFFETSLENQEKIKEAQGKVVAVGTTSLRVLESIKRGFKDQTNIFLHPGTKVESVEGLITNFHLPKSSLIMLVASLIGREKILELYEIAKKEQYRFYSYGDAMLIIR